MFVVLFKKSYLVSIAYEMCALRDFVGAKRDTGDLS